MGTFQKTIIEAVELDIEGGTWFRFEKTLDLETQGEYPGARFIFRAGLGEVLADLKIAQVVNFDVGVRDFVEPVNSSLSSMFEGDDISQKSFIHAFQG